MGNYRPSVRCLKCRHEVAGVRVGRCPECGAKLTEHQRRSLGLPSNPPLAERLHMLAEFLHDCEFIDADAVQRIDAEADRLHQWTDEDAAPYLAPYDNARDLYRVLRRAGLDPVESLCRSLEVVMKLRSPGLDDRAALESMPPSPLLRDLYKKLRELGYEPLEAIDRIVPHIPSLHIEGWP